MAGFPLLAIGSALTGFMQGYDQEQKLRQQQQMQQLQSQAILKQLHDQQQTAQAQGLAFQSLLSGGIDPNAGAQNLPGLGAPMATPQPPMPGQASVPSPPMPGIGTGPKLNMGLTPQQIAVASPIISRDESNNQNVPQTAYSGVGINPSTMTHTPPSTASGFNQITDTTWRGAAPKAGVDIAQYPTAMSAPRELQDKVRDYLLATRGTADYAPFNPRLARDLSTAGIPVGNAPTAPGTAALNQLVPPQLQQQARMTAVTAANKSPTMIYGGANIQQMAQAIDKANPGADPTVKFLALSQYAKLMQPEDKAALQMMLMQNREQFALALKDMQIRAADDRVRLAADKPQQGQIFQQPDGSFVRVTPQGVQPIQGLQPGATKPGTPSQNKSPLTDAAAERYAKIFQTTGYLPPGIARSSAAIAQIMNKTGDTGTPGEFVANLATRQADTKSLANLTKIADAATSYENTAIRNFDQALRYKSQLSTTDWGPWFNKWIVEGDKALGDPTAPAYVVALLTAANEYAKVMSGGTGAAPSTEGSRREAYEMFSPYLNQGQIEQVIAVAKQEMENRRQELYAGVDDVKARLRGAGTDTKTPVGHTPGSTAPPQAQLPTDLPDPTGLPDGKVAMDQNGKVVARIQGGKWVQP